MADDAKAPVAQAEDDTLDEGKHLSTNRDAKVEFKSAKNGDAILDMQIPEIKFSGLGKEELMKVAYQPFWVRIRWIMFILFWLSWLGMIGGAIGIILVTPRCKTLQNWQKAPIYQIYPRSFQDSSVNGTNAGVGDLQGIIKRLPHLKDIGAKTVWLSPIYKSPMKDFGYDISDFTAIDPTFGTMEDFKELAQDMKERDIALVMDYIPNHSSNEHEWFKKSVRREEPYTNYYVWRAGTPGTPPNNWLSVFGGSAWEWNTERGEYYLHQFYPEQPDLNVRNPAVVEEIKNIIRFWMQLGVTGFRMDAVPHLFESENFEDEPSSGVTGNGHDSLNHTATMNLPEIYGFLRGIREVMNEFESDSIKRIMLTEAYTSLDNLMLYYGNETDPISDLPMNFGLITEIKSGFTGHQLHKTITDYLNRIPSHGWPNWVVGNHDNSRVASRVGSRLVDGVHMITMLLPGTPVTYYGEEIGMEDNPDIPTNGTDSEGRDRLRTPMQWDNSTNAGFSQSGNTWLPVNKNYETLNVKAQEDAEESHLKVYKELVNLRSMASAQHGCIHYPVITDNIFSFARNKTGNANILVAVNVGDVDEVVDFQSNGLPESLTIKLRSVGFQEPEYTVGAVVNSNAVKLRSKNGIVFTF